MADHIRYDLLTQQALRGVVRNVLADAAKKGLPGDHHFYISFDTSADGVRLSDRLRAQYPKEMTVILQHQFWDLAVNDHGFEVGMSFGGIPEKLVIPFDAITGFFDPSVQFGLQFEEIAEGQNAPATDAAGKTTDKTIGKTAETRTGALAPVSTLPPAKVDETASEKKSDKKSEGRSGAPTPSPLRPVVADAAGEPDPDKPSGGGEVVRLDRFRKK